MSSTNHTIFKRSINSLEDWYEKAPPINKDKQWKKGRSAYELAKAWFPRKGECICPAELANMFEKSGIFNELSLLECEPEVNISFDEYSGPRRSDLILTAHCNKGIISVSIEAKADESFGKTVKKTLESARSITHSKISVRLDLLSKALFSNCVAETIMELRYQLIYALGAALSLADMSKAVASVFIIHEFHSAQTERKKLERNAADMDKFIAAISSNKIIRWLPDNLYGPFYMPGNTNIPSKMPCYLGRIISKHSDLEDQ